MISLIGLIPNRLTQRDNWKVESDDFPNFPRWDMLAPERVKHEIPHNFTHALLKALEELREDVAVAERLCETRRQDGVGHYR